ncbi:MAG TPA: hypothetical protein VN428_06685 [Bryobacteraceae bacterium]|nr:hypothetical protein [Bryobacteraceae bacterium]
MALFTDGPAATIEGLREYESSILDVAATEGIDLTVKLSAAHREVGIDLERFLDEAAQGRLSCVAVTAPLAAWETFHALVLTFRDAYHSQLNDRHLPKWKEYERRAKWASEALFQLGVGLMYSPIPKPGLPVLKAMPGSLPAGLYYVRTTWARSGGAEGAPSDIAVLSAPGPTGVEVRCTAAPSGVAGWNVYAGESLADITLQNDVPLTPAHPWTIPVTGLRAGRASVNEQQPDTMVKRLRTF